MPISSSPQGSLRDRPTARVVLLDPANRILLMRARMPSNPTGPSFWFTVGGGAEPGETPQETAAREVVEETGLLDAELGPIVWYSEAILHDERKQPFRLIERFLVARTQGGALSRHGWQALERQLVDELRWWTLEELSRTDAKIYPEGLAELLVDVLAGRFAAEPLVIRTLDGPVTPLPKVGPRL
jgi:8-oxo-dGTP pyrophosphatase MutT (NUDIX family)